MMHAWENGAKQAIARKCRDARRATANDDDDYDEEDGDQDPQQTERQRLELRRLAREFIDDEAVEDNEDSDDELPVLLTPPYQLTPTQTQDIY